MASEQTNSRQGGRSFQELMHKISSSFSSMQSPSDFIILLEYCTVIYTPIRILLEAGILQHLASCPGPLTLKQLAANIANVDPARTLDAETKREEFVSRMLRVVTALQLVDETGPMTWQGNELTRTLGETATLMILSLDQNAEKRCVVEPGFDSGFKFIYDATVGPSSANSKLLAWATDHGYIAPETSLDGPYQQAHGIVGTTTFDHWVNTNGGIQSARLSALMKRIQQGRLNWSAWFRAEALFQPSSNEDNRIFMIDVGGCLGHDLQALATKYPNREIQLMLQDLPSVIANARKESLDPRIQLREHDFFTPQPVKGAKIYFMHKIMHDWPDAQAAEILTHLRYAMAPDSRIFINDVILPDQGAPLVMAAFDIMMLAMLSAKERSESMWERLIESVGGLKVVRFWQAPELKGEGIVEVVRTSK